MAYRRAALHDVSLRATTSQRWKTGLLAGLTAPILLAVALMPAIPQSLEYHDFADQRSLAGAQHFWNVASNLPFALIGFVGCLWLVRNRRRLTEGRSLWAAYFVFFLGEFLTCFGSAYYHADPGNDTLVWDRLVFSLLLTSFFTIAVGELISSKAAQVILAPIVLVGLLSVVQWHWTESIGAGDLRLYLLVQFYPVLAVPVIALLFRTGSAASHMVLSTWALYAAAKLCETFDAPLYTFTGFWSGHTLKHFIAAGATVCVLRRVMKQVRPTRSLALVPLRKEAMA